MCEFCLLAYLFLWFGEIKPIYYEPADEILQTRGLISKSLLLSQLLFVIKKFKDWRQMVHENGRIGI